MSQPQAGIAIALAVVATGSAYGQQPAIDVAQAYPTKPLRLFTSEPGGGADIVARVIAQGLVAGLGQQVIVDNRSGIVATETVARAQPDGYTMLLYGSAFWISPLLQNTRYDPVGDFLPVTATNRFPNILAVHPSLPAKSVRDLIALARNRPGDLNYSAGGAGSSTHLSAELFKAMSGADIVRINYKGAGPALNALISGEVQLIITSAISLKPHVQSGRLRGLAVTTAEPTAVAPGMPTVAASGLPGYESVGMTATFVPARVTASIVQRLNQEIVRVLNKLDVKDNFLKSGVETVGNSPEELAATMKSEVSRMGKVIKDAGILVQ